LPPMAMTLARPVGEMVVEQGVGPRSMFEKRSPV